MEVQEADFPPEQRSRWLPAESTATLRLGVTRFLERTLRKSHSSTARYVDRGVALPPEALFCWTDGDFEMYVEPWSL